MPQKARNTSTLTFFWIFSESQLYLWRRPLQLLSFVLHDHHDLIMLFNPFGNVPSKFTS